MDPPTTWREFFSLAAWNIILKVDPYTGILHHVGRYAKDGTYGEASKLIAEAVAALPATPRNTKRAHLENLRGIVALLDGDVMAETYFRQSAASKPDFAVAWLNLAFALVHRGKYQEAVEVAGRVTNPWWRAMTDNPKLLSSAQSLIGMARWRMGDDVGAVAAFREALDLNPNSAEAYVYWGRLLGDQGQTAAAARKFEAGRRNAAYFNNFPEVAILYFWVPDKPGQRLTPRPNLISKRDMESRTRLE